MISSSDGDADRLKRLVEEFGEELTATVRAIASDAAAFRGSIVDVKNGTDRIVLTQDPSAGIRLTVDGSPLLTLRVEYWCSFDRAEKYLAVDTSRITVLANGASEPLFRYEYVREPASKGVPTAHLQIHAHRDAFVYVMTRAGTSTPRGKRRARADGVPHLSELHFPLGGPRFRPCLEDVVEMLIDEFGIDCGEPGREALRLGREAWRKKQLAAAVRDAPDIAVHTLENEFGFVITPPPDNPPRERTDKLRAP